MIFVIGPAYSGKKSYLKACLGFKDEDISGDINEDVPVLSGLQELITADCDELALLPKLLKKQVVICRETGAGIVPLDKSEREKREKTGRICIELAKHAERVVRLCCGVPAVIKQEAPYGGL